MFTGIILDVGKVAALQSHGEDLRAQIEVTTLPLSELSIGDSVAVNGVCLTAIEFNNNTFAVDVSAESLACTTLGTLAENSRVNLETALTPSTALGGHMVSGHVDGVGKVIKFENDGRSIRYEFEMPDQLAKYVVPKGSITIDGVSLTVNTVADNHFAVNIIPHTMEKTIFAAYQVNTSVNLEVDVVARYLEKLLITK